MPISSEAEVGRGVIELVVVDKEVHRLLELVDTLVLLLCNIGWHMLRLFTLSGSCVHIGFLRHRSWLILLLFLSFTVGGLHVRHGIPVNI